MMVRIGLLGAALSSAVCAGPAAAEGAIDLVRFGDGVSQPVRFVGSEATAYDEKGTPKFSGTEAFFVAAAQVSNLQVLEWDVPAGRVRVSARNAPQLWIKCSSLQVMPIACSTSFEVVAEGVLQVGRSIEIGGASKSYGGVEGMDMAPTSPAALPRCPGDPRCPRVGN
jgi:hypothetical protein